MLPVYPEVLLTAQVLKRTESDLTIVSTNMFQLHKKHVKCSLVGCKTEHKAPQVSLSSEELKT